MLNIKKIIIVLMFLLPITFIKATTNNSSSNHFTIDIANLNFIYLSTTGSVEDLFEDQIKEITDFALSYSLNVSKVVVVFVDNTPPAYNEKKNKYDELVSNNNKIIIDKNFLIKEYGLAYLQAKRRVLIGVLAFPFVNIQETNRVRVVNFKDIKASGFSVVIPKDTDNDKDIAKVNDFDKSMQTYNRTIALKFLNTQKKQNILTLFEITDRDSGGVSYINFPIPKEEALQMYENSQLLTDTTNQ